MNFEKQVPDWNAEGVEPPVSLKESGFEAGYKPPAAFFNWFWHGVSACLAELQAKLSRVDNTADMDKPLSQPQEAAIKGYGYQTAEQVAEAIAGAGHLSGGDFAEITEDEIDGLWDSASGTGA